MKEKNYGDGQVTKGQPGPFEGNKGGGELLDERIRLHGEIHRNQHDWKAGP